jgi:hypothetical protein
LCEVEGKGLGTWTPGEFFILGQELLAFGIFVMGRELPNQSSDP